jgi:serine/threonine protein kinase
MDYKAQDLAALIRNIDNIKITDDTPPAALEDSLRILHDQQHYVARLIDNAKTGGNTPASVLPELHKTYEKVSKMVATINDLKARAHSKSPRQHRDLDALAVRASPNSSKKKPAGPPEIPPEEIIFDPVKDYLGGGAYGKVYRGICRGKDVAIKVPVRQHLSESELKSFRNEVEIMRHIFHPNVVLFLGASTQPNRIMIVTELMKTDMEKLIHHNPEAHKISLYTRMKMAKDAALGMNWLHGICRIIHRDLKPANLLIDSNMTVKVTDFGFAETVKADRYLLDKRGPKGTALYMAPEVMRQEKFNEKADVYSFGLILWELVTGEELFPQYEDLDPFYQAICFDHERPIPPPDTPRSLEQLMRKCWDPNPEVRTSFEEIISCLDDILIECCIQDTHARKFWKDHFLTPSKTLQEEVSWNEFIHQLRKSLNAGPELDSETIPLLTELIPEHKPGNAGSGGHMVVSMERLQLLTSWFGPFFVPIEGGGLALAKEIAEIQSKEWFHGMISKDVAERRLRLRSDNTFLVRLSMADPSATPFTISKVRGGRPTHKRVTRLPPPRQNTLSVPLENSSLKFTTLIAMIDHLKKIGNLGEDCPHSEISNPYVLND